MAAYFVRSLPLLVLGLSFITTVEGGNELTIQVQDDMPAGSEIARVNCTDMWFKMHPGNEFHFADDGKYWRTCNAIWMDLDGSWMAFDPSRDAGQQHLFSSVRTDGFYYSYDQSDWKKLDQWRNYTSRCYNN